MKILLPYLTRSGVSISDPKVLGGVERFAQLLYQNVPSVIPVEFTDDDRKARRVTKLILDAYNKHNPDIIISNYDNNTTTVNVQKCVNVPYLWISHSAAGGISKIGHCESMHEFVSAGGTLAMVSEWQYEGMNKLSNRLFKKNLPLHGYINPAFCSGDEYFENEWTHDAVTIGRTNNAKNPFWLHKKLQGSNKTSLVLTNSPSEEELYGPHKAYYDANVHWDYPQETLRGLPHADVMKRIHNGKYYVSTWPVETWGITALEALSRGIKVILSCNSTMTHASETIAANPNHVVKVKSTVKQDDLIDILNKDYSREEIFETTIKKHTKELWLESLEKLINTSQVNFKHTSTLEDFM